MTPRTLLVLGLCSAAPAVAADYQHGAAIFRDSCSQCHSADLKTPSMNGARDKGRTGPNLAQLARRKPAGEMKEWISEPQRFKPQTACDTRRLPEAAVNDVLTFLLASREPPPPPLEVRLQKNLEEGVKRVKKYRRPKAFPSARVGGKSR